MKHETMLAELRALCDKQDTDGHSGHWFVHTDSQRAALAAAIDIIESLDPERAVATSTPPLTAPSLASQARGGAEGRNLIWTK